MFSVCLEIVFGCRIKKESTFYSRVGLKGTSNTRYRIVATVDRLLLWRFFLLSSLIRMANSDIMNDKAFVREVCIIFMREFNLHGFKQFIIMEKYIFIENRISFLYIYKILKITLILGLY